MRTPGLPRREAGSRWPWSVGPSWRARWSSAANARRTSCGSSLLQEERNARAAAEKAREAAERARKEIESRNAELAVAKESAEKAKEIAEQARVAAESANAAKSEFLANM